MLKVANSVIDASRITGVLPVVNGGTGVTTSTGTGNTVLSATPTLSGDVTLSTGNLIPSTAAKGINFTANTPSAGMTSQLLNWYEEGTWTPVVTAGVGSITTVGSVSGRYTRNGRIVTLEFRVAITVNGTGSAYLLVDGMPFASNSSLYFVGCGTRLSTSSLGLCISANTTTQMIIANSDGTYPGGNLVLLQGQLTYSI